MPPQTPEATISWDAQVPGEGNCTATDYQVWVERISDGDRTGGNEVTSPWTATGLEASTDYGVTFYTYSAACDDISAEPATAKFSNTAANSAEKHALKRVRRLRAVKTTGLNDSASLIWNAPRAKNGKHHSASEYAVKVFSVGGDHTTPEAAE